MRDFVKFVGHYAGEIRAVSSLFGSLFRVLPIDPADRRQAESVIDRLASAADNIERGLSDILADGQINRDDLKIVVREVVREMLPDVLGGATEAATRKAAKPARVRNRAPKKAARLPTAAEQSTGG